jgi:hypothetical protein
LWNEARKSESGSVNPIDDDENERKAETACNKKRREADPNAPDQICNSISDAQCKDEDKHEIVRK